MDREWTIAILWLFIGIPVGIFIGLLLNRGQRITFGDPADQDRKH